MENAINAGTLYIVATPIGNLGDLSPRAVDVLSAVQLIAVEDTRRSRPMMAYFGISTPLVALHEHNEREIAKRLLRRLASGESIALVSDAGTPLISDPGFHLVRSARAAGMRVVPVPGPNAAICALSVAGLPSDRFVFEGFLHSKAGSRKARLKVLRDETRTLIFYESSHRIVKALKDMGEIFSGDRPATVGRELTKQYETVLSGTLADLVARIEADADQQRGEFVVVVAGAESDQCGEDQDQARVLKILLEELSPAQAARLAAKITGGRKNALYAMAQRVTADGRDDSSGAEQ